MTVAVKKIKKYESDQETSDFHHEMRITMDLMHPNIIHLYGIVDEGSQITIVILLESLLAQQLIIITTLILDVPWLVLQYFPNGDLKKYLIVSFDQYYYYIIADIMYTHFSLQIKQNNEHSVDQLIKYMINVAMGMHYITEKGLVHRVSINNNYCSQCTR